MRTLALVALTVATAVASAVVVDASGWIEPASASPKSTATASTKQTNNRDTVEAIAPQMLYLVRSTLGALQDANTTGNYSVLRDLSAPSFQGKHSAADLAEIFSAARRKPIDLTAAVIATPIVTDTARPSPERLQLAGHVGQGPRRVGFQLHFEAVNGHWRIAGLSVSAMPLQ